MLTRRQLELRRKHLQASDMPAVLGEDEFRSPADVYYSKVEGLESPSNQMMELGNLLEPPLVGYAAKRIGAPVDLRNRFRVAADGIIGCNLDAPIRGRDEAIEAKVTSLVDDWGDDGTDQIPLKVLIQVQTQMHAAELRRVHVVAALLQARGIDIRVYPIDRNEEIVSHIVTYGLEWWNRHIVGRTVPEGRPASLDVLKGIRRVPGKVAELNLSAVALMEQAAQYRLQWEKAEKEAKARIIMALNDAEAATFGDESRWLTYFEQKGQWQFDVDQMKADGVFEKYAKQGTHRVLRISKKPKQLAKEVA